MCGYFDIHFRIKLKRFNKTIKSTWKCFLSLISHNKTKIIINSFVRLCFYVVFLLLLLISKWLIAVLLLFYLSNRPNQWNSTVFFLFFAHWMHFRKKLYWNKRSVITSRWNENENFYSHLICAQHQKIPYRLNERK